MRNDSKTQIKSNLWGDFGSLFHNDDNEDTNKVCSTSYEKFFIDSSRTAYHRDKS